MNLILIVVSLLLSVGLIITEALMPGFGLPGISGILFGALGIGMTARCYGALTALITVVALAALMGFAISCLLRNAQKGGRAAKLFLHDSDELSSHTELGAFIGHKGTARSALRPAGIGDFDGVRLNVVTEGDFIENGTKIEIVRAEGTKLIVRRLDA